MKLVIHKQIYLKDFPFKGCITNTTLCRKQNQKSWDVSEGSNVSNKDEEVTCKLCLRKLKLKHFGENLV